MKVFEKINAAWGVIATFFAAVFGELWFLFAAFLALNIVDYITGVAKAKYFSIENSNKGAKGIAKKTGYWVVIAIAFFVALTFERMGAQLGLNLAFVELFGWLTLATFIINEIRSILENLVAMGVEVPKFLVEGLEIVAKTVNERSETDEDSD